MSTQSKSSRAFKRAKRNWQLYVIVALPVIWPFFVAFLVALLLKPVIRFLREKCRIQKNVAGVVTVLLFYAVVGLLIAFISVKLFAMVKDFVLTLPSLYGQVIEPFLVRVGLLARTPRGRIATAAAYRHLGVVAPGDGTSRIEGFALDDRL